MCLAYNATIHTSAGHAPHELFYSFAPTCPLDIIVEAERDEEPVSTADQYALEATERLQEGFRFMRDYSGKQVECMKTNYDASIKPKQFNMGSFVLLFHPPKKKNVFGRWRVAWKRPFRIIKKLNESNYVVQCSVRSQSFVVHGDRLRLYHGKIEDGAWPKAFLDAAQGA